MEKEKKNFSNNLIVAKKGGEYFAAIKEYPVFLSIDQYDSPEELNKPYFEEVVLTKFLKEGGDIEEKEQKKYRKILVSGDNDFEYVEYVDNFSFPEEENFLLSYNFFIKWFLNCFKHNK